MTFASFDSWLGNPEEHNGGNVAMEPKRTLSFWPVFSLFPFVPRIVGGVTSLLAVAIRRFFTRRTAKRTMVSLCDRLGQGEMIGALEIHMLQGQGR